MTKEKLAELQNKSNQIDANMKLINFFENWLKANKSLKELRLDGSGYFIDPQAGQEILRTLLALVTKQREEFEKA